MFIISRDLKLASQTLVHLLEQVERHRCEVRCKVLKDLVAQNDRLQLSLLYIHIVLICGEGQLA